MNSPEGNPPDPGTFLKFIRPGQSPLPVELHAAVELAQKKELPTSTQINKMGGFQF